MLEIEYKFKVLDKDHLSEVINKLGAILVFSKQYQKSTMFDNSEGLMQKSNGRVRLRLLGDTGRKQLTYKLPLTETTAVAGVKKEIEHEIEFTDVANNIESILQAMGYTAKSGYERYQSQWKSGDCKITLDEYPFANFLELEGEEDKIGELAARLGFSLDEGLTLPVDSLFQQWRKERNLPYKSYMTFADGCK